MMKKVLFTLMVSLAFCGSVLAQRPSHWPDFNLNDFPVYDILVAYVQIDGEIVTSQSDYVHLELCAFVDGEVRGPRYMVDDGDLYPEVAMAIRHGDSEGGKEVTFRLYDHTNGVEYTNVTVLQGGEPITILTGQDHTEVYFPDREPIFLSFSTPTFTKHILPYTPGSKDHYYLLATPVGNVNITTDVTNMTSNSYDLYSFDQNANDGLEWINLRAANTVLVPGTGYLYANSGEVDIVFHGFPYEGSGNVTLHRDVTNNPDGGFEGLNLVGNPFGVKAYIDRDFYVMNESGTEIVAAERDSIGVMEGIFVEAESDGETMTFTAEPNPTRHNGQIVLNVTRNRGDAIDRAIVRFGEGGMLSKFMLNSDNTNVYIPQDGKDYAVVRGTEAGELPVNFKAAKNGNYTINVNAQNVDVNYLHLIDNQTGADINLLQTQSYTFNALTTDYPSRFKLVFSTGANTEDVFSFYNNGNWVINNDGEAILQVVDVTGHIMSSEAISGCFSKHIEAAPGVYMLRLINGDNVKVQKVVVK